MTMFSDGMLLGDGASPVTPLVSYINAYTGNTSASQTISSVSIGAEDPNRIVVVVACGWYNLGVTTGITAMSIGGVSANLIQVNSATASTGMVGIGYLAVPTGTTLSVGLTFSAGGFTGGSAQIAVFRVIANSATPSASNTIEGATATQNLTLGSGAVGVFCTSGGDGQSASSYSNATQDVRLVSGSTRPFYAGRITAPISSFGVTMSNASKWKLGGVSWS